LLLHDVKSKHPSKKKENMTEKIFSDFIN
jgi:hypothetical protein